MSATGEAPEPWHERMPERLEWELGQFAERGLPSQRRLGLSDGRYPDDLVVATELPFKGELIPVEVILPFDYPDSTPLIFGPPGLLERHQQPLSGNFCWAEDADRDWDPRMDAAQVVAEDVRWLLEDSEKGPDAVTAGEAALAEPITGLLLSGSGVVLVPDPFLDVDLPATKGKMETVGSDGLFMLAGAAGLASADPALVDRYFPRQRAADGYWVALAPTPTARDLQTDLLRLVEEAAPEALARLDRRFKRAKGLPLTSSWLGVTFMEEGPTRGAFRRNWLFARLTMENRDRRCSLSDLLRAQALTAQERLRRMPELAGLADVRVLVIGAGSLGAPVLCELAKAGAGHLDVVDADQFDANNSVRHVLSPRAAGARKAAAMAQYAMDLNPFVKVEGHDFRVGGGATEAATLSALVADATVVIDTTGSPAVARILQRHARDASRPLVVAGLSAGSYGGDVALLKPEGACFECLILSQGDGTIPTPDAAPPTSLVTPIGCSHPAFSGTGFDATELAALTARTAVAATGASSYPDVDFDWAVINLRSEPHWQTGRLAKHAHCPRCA